MRKLSLCLDALPALREVAGLGHLDLGVASSLAELANVDRLRIGIGVGPGVLVRVGGVDGQWHFAIGGPPFDQIGRTAAKADRGEVVLSWEAREAIESSSHGQQLEDGSYRLTGVDPVTMPDPVPLPELGDEMAAEVRSFCFLPGGDTSRFRSCGMAGGVPTGHFGVREFAEP